MDRGHSRYTLQYKKYLEENNKSPNTIRSYITAVKSFYDSYDIRPPKVKIPKGDIGLEKTLERFQQKKN